MDDTKNGTGGPTVAYIPFKTFTSFAGTLAENGIPHRIDHTVMAGKSGSAKSALKGAMEFLGLIKENGAPTARLKELTEAYGDREEWQTVLGDIISEAYSPVIGDLNLDTGTAKQLADRFRESANVSGSTLTRAVRFYLSALQDAGLKYSKYFAAPQERGSGKAKKPRVDDTKAERTANQAQKDDPTPKAWKAHEFNLPTREAPVRVIVPEDIASGEWKIVNSFMEAVIGLRGERQ